MTEETKQEDVAETSNNQGSSEEKEEDNGDASAPVRRRTRDEN